jgi:hypothetical protein
MLLKFLWFTLLIIIAFHYINYAQLQPGVERWSIKTSLPKQSKKKNLTLDQMLHLKNPVAHYSKTQNDAVRFPQKVDFGLKEGDIVTVTGWLHLVALENSSKDHRDGDFHIQLRNSQDWGDSCLIVEVPNPDTNFVKDSDLLVSSKEVRDFIKTKMLKGKEPGTAGNKMIHPCHVTIKGQLFFDATHLNSTPRGKRKMKSYTCWEIHPITSIKFAPK